MGGKETEESYCATAAKIAVVAEIEIESCHWRENAHSSCEDKGWI